MRKFLGTLVILLLIIAAVGLFRGWFGVSAEDEPGQTNVEVTIDKEKIKQDAQAASEKARELTGSDDADDADDADEASEPASEAPSTDDE